MKRTTYLFTVALFACSLLGCGNRNISIQNQGTNQNGTNMNIGQSSTEYAEKTKTHVVYRDGVYLGEGNKTPIGNQAAIVTIRNGEIYDILLKNIDIQGRDVNYNAQHPNVMDQAGGSAGSRSGSGAAESGTNEGIAGGITGGSPSGIDARNIKGPAGSSATGSTLNNVEQARRDLVNAIINKQGYDVSINSGDITTVENWKLAVRRALEAAQR